jgi:DNA-binding transcriptional LysR family regulator
MVVELGSFREAAYALNISQPALSRRIQKLEEILRVQLLDRTTRQVSLSMVGRVFFPRARHLVGELDSSLLSVREIAERVTGHISVACLPTATFHFLPEVLNDFGREFPRVRVRIRDQGANAVLKCVLQGEADLGINLLGLDEPEVKFEPLLKEPFLLVCTHDHPLAQQDEVRWQDLLPYRLIMASRDSGNRLLIDQSLASLDTRPHPIYEVQHLTTALGMVEGGLGVAVMPQMTLPRQPHHLLVGKRLVDPVIEREVGIITRRGSTLSPAAAEFYRILKQKWSAARDGQVPGAPHGPAASRSP